MLLTASGLLAASGFAFAAPPVSTQLPTGGQVVAGVAGISQSGATLNVNQSTQNAAINWQTFNVGSAAQVNFNQPSASSVTLNRVLDSNPSQIFGRINANGQVFLTNPNGVYFSPTASVDVAGLVATTHTVSVADFMAGNYRFTRNGATGSVVNDGTLTASLGGYIALLAPEVRNQGVVVAQLGTAALAAGESYNLQLANGRLAGIQVEPSTIKALVENRHAVEAPGGLIILSALAIDQLQGGVVNNSGTLAANSLTDKGGVIRLEGDAITLAAGSKLDASGATGGGTALVGGDWQGSGGMHQATTVTMEQGATIDASATQNGNGGKVVLWSDVHNANSQTRAYGTILAKGGASGGNGGQIETSGHWLDVAGITANASAANGVGGLWLLDPTNVTITAAADAGGTFATGIWTPTATGSNISNTTIQNALNAGTSVTVTTTSALAEAGNINVNASIAKTAGGLASLVLQANNDIVVAAGVGITSTVGALNVTFNSDSDAVGGGAIVMNSGSSIVTNGGNIVMGGGVNPTVGYATGNAINIHGVNLVDSLVSLNSGGGNISIRGMSFAGGLVQPYVGVSSNATINSGTGTITLDGISQGTGSANSQGSIVNGLLTSSNNITLSGSSIGLTNAEAIGVNLGGTILATNGASIHVTGNGGTTSRNYGLSGTISSPGIILNGASILADSGMISLTGTGGSDATISDIIAMGGTHIGQQAGSAIANSSSQVVLNANTLSLTGTDYLQSSGTLTIAPRTAGTTIGIGGGAGTLQLLASYFTTNFVNGFSNITIGSATTGNLTSNGFTFGDNLTLWAGNANATAILSGAISNAGTGLSSGSLTINAAGDIASTAAITTQNQAVTLNSDSDAVGGGAILMNIGSSIVTNGGNITLGGGANPSTTAAVGDATYVDGILLTGATLDAGGGSISLRGTGASGFATSTGVTLTSSTVKTTTGAIGINGTGAGTGGGNFGVALWGSTVQTTGAGGNIALTGQGSTVGTLNNNEGIHLDSNGIVGSLVEVQSGSGNLTLNGTGGTGANWNVGVNNRVGSVVRLGAGATGSMLVTGTGGACSVGGCWGVLAEGIGIYESLGAGSIVLTGTGGTGAGSEGIRGNGNNRIGSTTMTGDITLIADTMNLNSGGTATVQSLGKLIVKPKTAGTTIGIGGGAGTLQLLASYFGTNFLPGFSGVTIGDATSGAITVGGATAFGDNTALISGGNIAINAALSDAGKILTLTGGNGATVGGAGNITAAGLLLNGAGANYALNTAAGNSVGTLAVANGAGNVSFFNNGALTVGSVGGVNGIATGGTVDVETLTGNLTVAQNIATTNTGAAAITLNAGRNTAAGTATGGDIVFGGGVLSTGVGGRATLYTGSVAGSTGVAAAAGAGNYRYNSDEATTNFTRALGAAGVSAIYREQPIVTVTANNASKIYDGLSYTGSNGAIYAGFVNGENATVLTGALAYTGNSQGATNAGTYAITPTGHSSDLGYGIANVSGTLTINSVSLTITANNATKTYDGIAYTGGNGVTYAGFVNGETGAVLIGTLTYTGSSQGAVNAGSYVFTPQGLSSNNYAINFVSGTLTINPAAVPPVAIPPVVVPPPPQVVPPVSLTPPPPLVDATPTTTATASNTPSNTVVGGGTPGSGSPTGGGNAAPAASPATGPVATGTTGTQPQPTAVSPTTLTAVTTMLASADNPAAALDALAGARVQTAIAGGMNPVQATQAGKAYSTVVAQQLSRGASMSEAVAHAEQVFQAEAAFPAPKSPQGAAARNLAAGGDNVASQLSALAQAKTASGSAAFDKALAASLAKGMSFADAVSAARDTAQMADALAKADNTPQGSLANGSAGLENRSSAYQKALGDLLAMGYTPEQAMQRAGQIAAADAAAEQADARNPASSLASGKLAALPESGGNDAALGAALARGLPLGEALKRAQQMDAAEQRAIAADQRNPEAGLASGRSTPPSGDAVFDQAFTSAIGRGETPAQALASAQRATTRFAAVKPTAAGALASGENVDALLLGEGSSRTYRTVLGNALSLGMPLDKALALAKRAEQANAFRYPLPAGLAQKLPRNPAGLNITMPDGKPLPSWLHYSPDAKAFVSYEVPDGALPVKALMRVGKLSYPIEITDGGARR